MDQKTHKIYRVALEPLDGGAARAESLLIDGTGALMEQLRGRRATKVVLSYQAADGAYEDRGGWKSLDQLTEADLEWVSEKQAQGRRVARYA